MHIIQRAVVVALTRWVAAGGKFYYAAPDKRKAAKDARRREVRYLELLANEFGKPVRDSQIQHAFGAKSSHSAMTSIQNVEPVIEPWLEYCGAELVKLSGSAKRKLSVRKLEEDRGYCFDALRFRFWKLPKPSIGSLEEKVCIEWIDENACGTTCKVSVAGKCKSVDRVFDPVLPSAVDQYRQDQDDLRAHMRWDNLTVVKVLSLKPPGRYEGKLVIECCKEEYRNFDCTNYVLPFLLRDDGKIVIENGRYVDPRFDDYPKGIAEESQTFRQHLNIPEQWEPDPVQRANNNQTGPESWVLGTNLGFSVCVIQVDDQKTPKGILLSWRASKPGSSSLRVGFNELHVGVSSQIKLEHHLQEAPAGLDDKNDRLTREQAKELWSDVDLKKAIAKECKWEAGLEPDEIDEYLFLGAGWLTDFLHPELLIAVTTRKDLVRETPHVEDLLHGDEFRQGGKGKFTIPVDDKYWHTLGELLVGFAPDGSKALMQWSAQGAVALIEANKYFFPNGQEQLENAIANIIEKELVSHLPEPLDFKSPSI